MGSLTRRLREQSRIGKRPRVARDVQVRPSHGGSNLRDFLATNPQAAEITDRAARQLRATMDYELAFGSKRVPDLLASAVETSRAAEFELRKAGEFDSADIMRQLADAMVASRGIPPEVTWLDRGRPSALGVFGV